MSKVFVTSDLFIGRENIIKLANRPFKSVNEMNMTLINNWNNKVTNDDIVYVLGNLAWDPLTAEVVVSKLNGKIFVMLGQYDDSLNEIAKYHQGKINIIPYQIVADSESNIVFSHWPLTIWSGKDMGHIHVHGHAYNSMKTDLTKENRVNVCTDHWQFAPIDLNYIIELIHDFNKQK